MEKFILKTSIIYFSFFDPDPESSCFGVSHYNGNVSQVISALYTWSMNTNFVVAK